MTEQPKILIVSRLNWDDNSNANTLTNLFDGYNPEKIARIYIESKKPNTKCCHHFYQISEVSLILKLFKWKTKTGYIVDTSDDYVPQESLEAKEQSIMSFARHHRSYLLSFLRDLLWSFSGWKTKDLKKFITEFNPDVVWLDGSPLILMNKLNNYVCSIAKKPSCTFLMDDTYTYKSCPTLSSRIYRYFLRKHLRKTVRNANHIFVASEKMKQEYDKEFSINSTFLAKGIADLPQDIVRKDVVYPIKMVYLGNVLIGRLDSLILLAKSIHKINKEQGKKFELSIYTGDYISKREQNELGLGDSIHLCGLVPYSEVNNVIESNDIVVFVEALEGRQNRIARLSFSTKIVDYIASGKCIFTIGPKDSAPVEYLKDNNISLVAHSVDEIYSELKRITPEVIRQYGIQSIEFAKKRHDKSEIQKSLYEIIDKVANSSNC